jgi:hypothetical protein
MAYSSYPSTQSSCNYGTEPLIYPNHSDSLGQHDDPVRKARDLWAVRKTHISDSSEIIDSIDVDMIDVGTFWTYMATSPITRYLSRLLRI